MSLSKRSPALGTGAPFVRRAPALALAVLLAGCASHTAPVAPTEPLPTDVGVGQPYTSAQLDGVEPQVPPRLSDEAPMPAPIAYDPEAMPPYNGAQPSADHTPLTLEEIYAIALNNDPIMRGAYSEMQAVGYGVMAARAGMLPTVAAEANYTNVQQDVVQSENTVYQKGSASWPENSYALTLTQPIFDMGIYQKWRQAQESERKEVATFAFAQQDLMLRTATAYLSILAAKDQIELTAAERSTTQKQLELVQARYGAGQVTESGLSEVQARLDVQEANYLLVQSDYADKQQALQEIVGYGDLQLRPVRNNLPLIPPAPADVHAWLRQSLEQNWSIRVAAAAVAVAKKEVSVQRAGHYPTVNFKASTGSNETGGSLFGGGSTVNDTRYIFSLRVPLLQGGYTYAMSEAAANRLTAAHTQLSLARRKVQRQVFSAFRNIVVGIDRIKALGSSVKSFEQALDLKQQGYAAGLNDIVSVLDASRNLYNAKRQEAEARYNYVLDTLKLKQASGTLSEADIVAISKAVS